mmetsp:Transcript_95417/g.221458  ORF Transcript_95417/g.221458 Transcript_95417/m.221458 type:complete len:320 (-) Transcript_95417:3199-4158(-)
MHCRSAEPSRGGSRCSLPTPCRVRQDSVRGQRGRGPHRRSPIERQERPSPSPVEFVVSSAAVAVRIASRVLTRQSLVQDIVWWQVDQDSLVLDLDVEGGHVEPCVADPPAGLQVVGVLVDGAGDLGCVPCHAHQAAREDLQLLVRAGVLRGVPLVRARVVEDGKLAVADLHSEARVSPVVARGAHVHPAPRVVGHVLADLGRANDRRHVLHCDLLLLALLRPLKVTVLLVVHVGKLPKASAELRSVHDLLPFALVAVHLRLHARIELLAEAQLVVDHHLVQVLDAALQVLKPLGGPRERVGCEGVVHHHAVYVLQRLVI